MELDQMWQSALGEIQAQLSRANFATWLKNSRLVDKKDGTFYISVPNGFAKQWVEEKYHKNLLGILRNMDGSVKKIEYVISNANSEAALVKKAPPVPTTNLLAQERMDLDYQTDPETGLNPRYRLSSYIVGPSNELAFAAAEAIINDVGRKYNPFFIYGGVGLGKTHLIQAIGNEVLIKYGKKLRPRYIPSEQFARDVVWGIRNKRMEDVKKKYRDVDMLIIDDIQFIGGKDKMEEEFFHTFNSLYELNKQIVISSDKPPHSLPILQERLRSRFEGGFVADVAYPEFEVRVAIIKSKLLEANRQLSDDVVNVIARRLKKNIRELEGVLKRILFTQEQKQMEITAAMAEDIITKATQSVTKRVDDDVILKAVADFFNISVADLISHSRRKEVVEPRQITMYLLRDISELSYPHIGEKMGRDHTTAIHSFEKINNEVNRNSTLSQKILMIKELIYTR
jgi:chromosomal replication initiator protein